MLLTPSEQEYLRQVYLYTSGKDGIIHTKKLAELVKVTAASATDIVKRLAKKKLLVYNPYHGCSLSTSGEKEAIQIIRKHRLWELFLSEKLGIDWKEIHQMAVHLQSIESGVLIEQLSLFLGHPVYDPHGEPIPDENGKFPESGFLEILDLKMNQAAIICGYRDSGREFLEYIEKLNLLMGCEIQVLSIVSYDNSVEILIEKQTKRIISKETAQKVYVKVLPAAKNTLTIPN